MFLPSSWTRQIIPGTLKRASLWSVAAQSRPQLPSLSTTLPQAGQLRRMVQPPCSLLSAEINQAWSLKEAAFLLSHCCSGACLGDGAVVTTTVDTALEEPEAVPCCRWDAGTVWMRTCVA